MISINRIVYKNRRKIITSLVLIAFCLTILQTNLGKELYWGPVSNVSCHYLYTYNNLPLLETASLTRKSIFFHETSCPGNLTVRQLCAIESAAKAHPAWQINVIFSGNINSENIHSIGFLNRWKNVKFWKVNIDNFTKNTPLEGLASSDVLKKCRWGIERTTDILKYLTLYKWGGIYLDLDVVIAKPLGSLARNWAARENNEVVADGLLAISKDSVGRNVAEAAIRDIQLNYKNNAWCNYSPGIMMRVLQKLCSTPDVKYMSSATCNGGLPVNQDLNKEKAPEPFGPNITSVPIVVEQNVPENSQVVRKGFEVYGPQFFYPVEKQAVREYFTLGELRIHNAYSYYLWEHITNNYKIKKTSPYSKLAKRFCPKSYSKLIK